VSIIVGIDPGFANIGYAVVQVESWGEKLLDLGVIQTEKSNNKRKVFASDDNLRRAREISARLKQIIVRDGALKVAALCVESMSFPRNAANAAKVAMCWGCIATFSQLYGLPLVQSSPQEIKKKLCGDKTASKEEVAAAVTRRYANAPKLLADLAASYQEHPYDAAAAAITALDSEVLAVIRSLSAS
jgi:crossover junction endodeoxyribonuclease RuvC